MARPVLTRGRGRLGCQLQPTAGAASYYRRLPCRALLRQAVVQKRAATVLRASTDTGSGTELGYGSTENSGGSGAESTENGTRGTDSGSARRTRVSERD
eukprot:303152-Rhodomonas_salina.1